MEFRYFSCWLVGCLLFTVGRSSFFEILSIIVVSIVCFYVYLGFKYPQSDIKVIIKYAFPGGGKTLDLCREAVLAIKKGRKVYSSIPINVDGVIQFDPNDFGKGFRFYGDCLVLIDEGGIVFNNRNWKLFSERIEYTKLHRHDKARIIIYSQSPEDTDVTIRRVAQEAWDMKKWFGYFSLQRQIICENTIVEASDEDGVKTGSYGMNQRYASIFGGMKIYYQPYWYGLSDTYEMPSRFTQIPSEVIHCKMPYRFSDPLHKAIYRLNWLLSIKYRKQIRNARGNGLATNH